MSSSPRATSEIWNRSAPRNDNVTWGSGGIVGDIRDSNAENGGSTTRGGSCVLVSSSAFGCTENGGLLRPGGWISARAGGTGACWGIVEEAVLVGNPGIPSSSGQRHRAGTSSKLEGPGLFQIKNWRWPEGPDGAPTISYSHSRALFARTHLVHGCLASHFWGEGEYVVSEST